MASKGRMCRGSAATPRVVGETFPPVPQGNAGFDAQWSYYLCQRKGHVPGPTDYPGGPRICTRCGRRLHGLA